jgi:hypothetical protein
MVVMANAVIALGISGMLAISLPMFFGKRTITSEFLTVIS